MNSEQQRVALVTGGSAGLGFVVARTLQSHGYRVLIVGRDQDRLDRAGEQLGDSVIALRCDVTDAAQIGEAISGLALGCAGQLCRDQRSRLD